MNSKQESLFKEDQRRTRNVEKYVRAKSRDGSLSIRLDPALAKKVRKYCRLKQLNCKKLIEKIIRKRIEEKAKSKEAREAMRTMYETAFAEGFRISEEELENQDREVYIRIIAEELAEVDEDELKGVLRA